MVSDVFFLVPYGFDDPMRPSGGNSYDLRVAAELMAAGWRVHLRPVALGSPAQATSCLAESLAAVPDDSTVLVDGLVGSVAEGAMLPHARRLRLVTLVHLPVGAGPGPRSGGKVPGEDEQRTRRAEAAVLGSCRAVITTSEWTRSWLAEHYGLARTTSWVARPGADEAPASPGSRSGSRFLCVGAVTPVKGQDLLIAALGSLHQVDDLDWCCTVVGPVDRDPDYVASLREAVRRGGLGERIRIVGPMVGSQLQARYAACDLLVLPSRVESFGMVVTEALAHGIPVVATDVGGIPEAFRGATAGRATTPAPGTLVPAEDSRSLAAALRDWLTEPQTRDSWRAGARQRRHTVPRWTTTVEQVSQVLEQVSA